MNTNNLNVKNVQEQFQARNRNGWVMKLRGKVSQPLYINTFHIHILTTHASPPSQRSKL